MRIDSAVLALEEREASTGASEFASSRFLVQRQVRLDILSLAAVCDV